jgi:hypothetical protein
MRQRTLWLCNPYFFAFFVIFLTNQPISGNTFALHGCTSSANATILKAETAFPFFPLQARSCYPFISCSEIHPKIQKHVKPKSLGLVTIISQVQKISARHLFAYLHDRGAFHKRLFNQKLLVCVYLPGLKIVQHLY